MATLILGVVPALNDFIGGPDVLIGNFVGLWAIVIYGLIRTGSLSNGIIKYFYVEYDYGAFIIGILAAILSTFVSAFISYSIFNRRKYHHVAKEDQEKSVWIHKSFK
jgi:hypothetical protein